MTEDEAREWTCAKYGATATERLAAFLTMVVTENGIQNLIAPSTVSAIWARHAVDSAQLVGLGRAGQWVDIGTGGGFPGMVIAILRDDPIVLVEPRKRRAAFLAHCVDKLGLGNVMVEAAMIEKLAFRADTITARAVASIEKLLQIAGGCAKKDTRWLLPRGHLAEADMIDLEARWTGVFHVEQSVTEPSSSILVIDRIARR